MVLVVDLHPASAAVADRDSVLAVNRDASRAVEDAELDQLNRIDAAEGLRVLHVDFHDLLSGLGELVRVALEAADDVAIGIVNLDPAVAPVADIDVADAVDRDIGRALEAAAVVKVVKLGTEADQELAVGGEFLHAVVAPVGEVEVAVVVE